MNNNFFSLVRFLRDRDIDADLLLFNNEFAHFHPSQDAFDLDYQKFTRRLGWGSIFKVKKIDPQKIISDLKEYDYIIGCGASPAYLAKAGIKLNLFIPYGGDLYTFPFYRMQTPRLIRSYNTMVYYQRKGIRQSDHILVTKTNDEFEDFFRKLGVMHKVNYFNLPMVYTGLYNPKMLEGFYDKSHWFHILKRIREQNDLVIFHPSRLSWKNAPNKMSEKGNDKVIKGFSDFVQHKPQVKAHLVLFEYGPDVVTAKRLIKELDLDQMVTFFPLMPRKEIMIGQNLADICVGEIERSWFFYGVVCEALAMGTPFMGRRNDDEYKTEGETLYPMMNVTSQKDIVKGFLDFIDHPEKYQEMGRRAQSWFEEKCVNEPIEQLVGLINEATGRKS